MTVRKVEEYTKAVAWVSDEVQKDTCLDVEEATNYAQGFVTGLMAADVIGILPSDPTAEAFWRGRLRSGLAWERAE
jgi:hypothetical protein